MPITDIQGVKVFYGPPNPDTEDPTYRLTPAPLISINYSPIYANDHVIGITNKITLNGYISHYIQDLEFSYQGLEIPAEIQAFSIQSAGTGTEIISVESGNTGISTENNKILVTTFGDDPDRSGPITIIISTPTIFTTNNHGFLSGDTVVFNSGSLLPSGLEFNTTYYVLSSGLTSNEFLLSSSIGGYPIVTSGPQSEIHSITLNGSITTQTDITNASPTTFQKENHSLKPGDVVILQTDGNLPIGLETNTIYYVIKDGLANDSFFLSTSKDGTPNITTGTQSGNHSIIVEDDPPPKWNVTNASGAASMMNIRRTVKNINNVQSLLYKNGSTLTVIDTDNTIVLEGVGGILKSLSIDTGSNSWNQTVPFTAEIEFSYIKFFQEDLACATHWDSTVSSGLIDINQYPIKSFNDEWSITIDGESFNYIDLSDNASTLKISNNTIQLSYNLSAVGQDYYRTNQNPPQFKPAWEIAKHFVQERLYDQVTSLIGGIGKLSNESGCYENFGLTSGVISPLAPKYDVFNETINCSFSELDGSFSATYNSILKKKSDDINTFDSNAAKHSITKSINHNQNNNGRLQTSISINGSIEGLVPGGLINGSKFAFQLPRNGSFLIQSTTDSKYDKAYGLWMAIASGDDINPLFKAALGITNSSLGLSESCGYGTIRPYPLARSFTLTRNQIDGTIDYTIEYNNECISTDDDALVTVKNIAIDFQDSTPVFAEFILPSIGTVVQNINTKTAKEISFTITGRDSAYKVNTSYTTFPNSFILQMANTSIDPIQKLPNFPDYEGDGWTVKNRSQDINMIDGTYTMQLTYTCISGCVIL